MTGIRAIETHYKAYRFRSRLEARHAVFFDVLGVKWIYEAEGYDLGDAGLYLPDFFLPDVDPGRYRGEMPGAWLEVKGPDASPVDRAKIMALAAVSKRPAYLAEHEVDPENLTLIDDGVEDYGYHFWKCECGHVSIEFLAEYCKCPCGREVSWKPHPDIQRALDAARSTRFEEGEKCPT